MPLVWGLNACFVKYGIVDIWATNSRYEFLLNSHELSPTPVQMHCMLLFARQIFEETTSARLLVVIVEEEVFSFIENANQEAATKGGSVVYQVAEISRTPIGYLTRHRWSYTHERQQPWQTTGYRSTSQGEFNNNHSFIVYLTHVRTQWVRVAAADEVKSYEQNVSYTKQEEWAAVSSPLTEMSLYSHISSEEIKNEQ